MKSVARNFDEGRFGLGDWGLSNEVRAIVNTSLYPVFEAIVVSFLPELEIELGL